MAVAAGIGAAGAIGSSIIGSKASKDAASSQKKAAKKAAKIQQNTLNKQLALAKPYAEAGTNALAEYQKLAPYQPFGTPQLAIDPGYQPGAGAGAAPQAGISSNFQTDPGYQFRMSEGVKALERSAAARGLLQSGTALKGITEYGQNVASDEYQNAFQRYLAQREASMEPYRFLTGVGQAAAAGQASNIGAAGSNLAELAATRGNINAQSAIGSANAYGGALNTLAQGAASYAANQPYMNYLSSITPSAPSAVYNPTNVGGVY